MFYPISAPCEQFSVAGGRKPVIGRNTHTGACFHGFFTDFLLLNFNSHHIGELQSMTFRNGTLTYKSISATGIVRQLQQDAIGFKRSDDSLYPFLLWSLTQLEDRLPFRELDLSELVDEETLALSYLCMLDRYGLGEFIE
jgi:hypothetical protein